MVLKLQALGSKEEKLIFFGDESRTFHEHVDEGDWDAGSTQWELSVYALYSSRRDGRVGLTCMRPDCGGIKLQPGHQQEDRTRHKQLETNFHLIVTVTYLVEAAAPKARIVWYQQRYRYYARPVSIPPTQPPTPTSSPPRSSEQRQTHPRPINSSPWWCILTISISNGGKHKPRPGNRPHAARRWRRRLSKIRLVPMGAGSLIPCKSSPCFVVHASLG